MSIGGITVSAGRTSAALALAAPPLTQLHNTHCFARVASGAVAVHRGALVYALQLAEVLSVIRSHGLKSNDYNVTQGANPTIPWNAALVRAVVVVVEHSTASLHALGGGSSCCVRRQKHNKIPCVPFSGICVCETFVRRTSASEYCSRSGVISCVLFIC